MEDDIRHFSYARLGRGDSVGRVDVARALSYRPGWVGGLEPAIARRCVVVS